MVDMGNWLTATDKNELRLFVDRLQDEVRTKQNELDTLNFVLRQAHHKWESLVGAGLKDYIYEK